MTKFHFTFDKTVKSQRLKKFLLKKYNNISIKNAEIIIVAGGDGFMLNTIKKYIVHKKPFYGINCGSFGFLMIIFFSTLILNEAVCLLCLNKDTSLTAIKLLLWFLL